MSWAAHELESLILHKHAKAAWRVSYMAILVGALMPDFAKLPVYGLSIGSHELIKAPEPWFYHRGWPGMGPTHSLLFGVVVALGVWVTARSKPWSIGLLIGVWSHVLTDSADSVGVMLFFPFSTQHYNLGMWEYASQEGRYGDAAAYFSSLGVVWDATWLVLLVLLARRAFTNTYFHEHVEPGDPLWAALRRAVPHRDVVLRAVFRAYVVYGAARLISWFLWARLVNPNRGTQTMDFSWGGPAWVEDPPRFQEADTWPGFVATTLVGVAGVGLTVWIAWRFARRLPERAPTDEASAVSEREVCT